MFSGNHPPQIPLTEALRPPVRGVRNQRLVVRIQRIQAGHADQVSGVLPRHCEATFAPLGRDKRHLPMERHGIGIQREGIAQVMVIPDEYAVRHQFPDRFVVEIGHHALGQQHLLPQHHARPALIPGLASRANELVELTVLAQRHKNRPGRARTHDRQPFPPACGSGECKYVAVGGIHRQFRIQHTAPLTHAGQHAPQPLGDGGGLNALRTVMLAKHRQQPFRQCFESGPGHRQHGLANTLQRPSTLAQVGQVAEELPQQALLHLVR